MGAKAPAGAVKRPHGWGSARQGSVWVRLQCGLTLFRMHMSEPPDFRKWAARVARQAGEEPDANEARRLMGIAEYWVRLAEIEDYQRSIAQKVRRPTRRNQHDQPSG